MSFRAETDTLENELGKLKAEHHLSCDVERRRLERKLEVKNDELEDLKRELGFSKDAEAKAIKRYKRALEYNIEVEAEVAELKTRFEQQTGQLLGRLIHFKDKLAERELELGNLRGKMTAKCGNSKADSASERHVNEVKCSSKSRKRKEFAKPTMLSEEKLVGQNGTACDQKRDSPAYIQISDSDDVSSDANNHSDNSSSDVGDHKQDAKQTKIQFVVVTMNCMKITARVEPSLTIGSLKSKIQDKLHIPSHKQILILEGKRLKDSCTLAHYDIQKESIIYLVLQSSLKI